MADDPRDTFNQDTPNTSRGVPPPNLPIGDTSPRPTAPLETPLTRPDIPTPKPQVRVEPPASEAAPTVPIPPKPPVATPPSPTPPVPTPPETAPRTMQKDIASLRGPIPPLATPIETPSASPRPNVSTPTTEEKHQAIRTFQGDVARTIQTQNASLTSIALAENERRERAPTEGESQESSSRILRIVSKIILGVILAAVLLGMVIGAFWYYRTPDTVAPTPLTTDTLVPVDALASIEVNDLSQEDLKTRITDFFSHIEYREGNLTGVVPIITEDEGVTKTVSARIFLENLGVEFDAALLRSIQDDFLLARADIFGTHPVLVFSVSFFENAFAGILRSEPRLIHDFSFIATTHPEIPDTIPEETSLGSSTSIILTPAKVAPTKYVDTVIGNHDARVLYDTEGRIRLLYAFPNTETLVITGSDVAFLEIIDRLNRVEFAN